MFFSFCKAMHVPSVLRTRWGSARACLTLIYRQLMTRIAATSEECGSVRCAIYTSWEEAAAPRLGFPLPRVYSRLYMLLYPGEEAFVWKQRIIWKTYSYSFFFFFFNRLKWKFALPTPLRKSNESQRLCLLCYRATEHACTYWKKILK